MENAKDTFSKNVKMTGTVLAMIDVSMVSAESSMLLVSAQVVLKVLNVPLTMSVSQLDQLVLSIQIVRETMFASTIAVLSFMIQTLIVTIPSSVHLDTLVLATNVKNVME